MSAALREGPNYNECRRSQPIPKSEQPLKRGADPEHGLVGQASCLSLRDGQDGTCYNYMRQLIAVTRNIGPATGSFGQDKERMASIETGDYRTARKRQKHGFQSADRWY